MSSSLRQKSLRSSISLLSATLIASGAIVIASAGALAAPTPSIVWEPDSVTCELAAPYTVVGFAADVSHKGKWVAFTWTILLDGSFFATGTVERWDSGQQYGNSVSEQGSGAKAEVQISVLDRNGGTLLTSSESALCS